MLVGMNNYKDIPLAYSQLKEEEQTDEVIMDDGEKAKIVITEDTCTVNKN